MAKKNETAPAETAASAPAPEVDPAPEMPTTAIAKAAPGMVLLRPPKGTVQIGIPGDGEDEVLVFKAREDGLFEVATEHGGSLIANGFTAIED